MLASANLICKVTSIFISQQDILFPFSGLPNSIVTSANEGSTHVDLADTGGGCPNFGKPADVILE